MTTSDPRVVFLTSYARSLQQLCVRACDSYLNCGQLVSEVALPVTVIDALCDYCKTYLGAASGDIKPEPNVNQNRITWLRVKNDSAQVYARVPQGQFRADRFIADSVAAAGAAVHMLDQDLLSMAVSAADAVTASPPEKTQLIQYVYSNAEAWRKLPATKQYSWRNLETLQVHIDYGESREHICMYIHTICRITTLQNLSIQHGYFMYPYSVTCSISQQLPKLKRIDISFTNLLLVSDRDEDDMLLLRSYKRQYKAKGRCLSGLGVLGKPLSFTGAVGCTGNISCTLDDNADFVTKLLLRSKRCTTNQTMASCFRACSYYWNSGTIFWHATEHFMSSSHEASMEYWLKLLQLSIESLDMFKPSENVDSWTDRKVRLYLILRYLRTTALDWQERTTIFSHSLEMMKSGMMSVAEVLGLRENLVNLIHIQELQSKRHNHLPKKVLATLLTMCQRNGTDREETESVYILNVLINLTKESPLICQQLLSDCFRQRFLLMCCKVIDLDWSAYFVLEHRASIYDVIANIAEVEGLAHRLQDDALFAKVLRDCRRTDGRQHVRIRAYTTRILYWMLLDLKESPAAQHHEEDIRAALDLASQRSGTDGLNQHLHSSCNPLANFGRLLTSNIPSVIQLALREIQGMCCLSGQHKARKYGLMVRLEGLIPYIESIADDDECTEPTGKLAVEILQAVKEATTGLVL